MIRSLIIGSILNTMLLIIFIIFYFYSNYFLINKHYFKVDFGEEYKELNTLVYEETDFIIDYYFNLIKYNDPYIFVMDLKKEILQVIDPVIYKSLAKEYYFWSKSFGELNRDKVHSEFLTKRNHEFQTIKKEIYLSIESMERESAEDNANLIIDEINQVYNKSIFQNSYNRIKERLNIKNDYIKEKIEFLNKNTQEIFEREIINGKNYFFVANKSEILEQEYKKIETLKFKIQKIDNIYNQFKNFFNDENYIFLNNNFEYTKSFKEFPLSIFFVFITIQIIMICYIFSFKYYLK